ncbi:hypothetical protein, partial [Providencia sp. PROV216]|uniref:hypothetical protein n=1 Tax=Providencia sp. PROV216 TaxID=2949912 RepID=UPI00234A826B
CDPDHPKCEAALEHAWGLVLKELGSANGRFIKLVEGKSSEPAAANGGTIDLEELPSTGVTILEENAPEVDSISCGCGLRLELSGLLLKEHNFSCPDQLRGRKGGWYSRDGSAYTYTGATHESLGWPDWLDEWMIVNGIDLSYDCCLYQVYESGSAIGWHADDEVIFAVNGSILTVNLGGQVKFGLRCAAGCVLNDISGACKFEMPAGFQQDHKHCVREASEGRSSLTFRKLKGRPALQHGEGSSVSSDVSMNETELGPATDSEVGSGTDSIDIVTASSELKYQMGVTNWEIKSLKDDIDYLTVPMMGDGNCFWRSIAHCLGMDFNVVKQRCVGITMPDQGLQDELAQCALPNAFTTNAGVYAAVVCLRVNLRIWLPEERLLYKCTYPQSRRMCDLKLSNEHFEPLLIKNGCVVQAIAAALDRDIEEVVNVLDLQGDDDLTQELFKGKGLDFSMVEVVLQIFDIRGHVRNEGVDLLLNENGRLERFFDVTDDHMSFIPRMKDPSHNLLTSAPLNKGFSEHQLHHLFLAGTSVSYLPLRERARVLANSLHQASTGKISSALFHHKENLES